MCKSSLEKVAQAKNWLMVFGIFGIISGVVAFGSAESNVAISEICYAVAYILGSVIVNKVFLKEANQ